ncbi:MAG: hypothetical protein HY782_01885 [Chloroflexi bacterium]|nr:hypothetical protein [Chloroflexota bacterium]
MSGSLFRPVEPLVAAAYAVLVFALVLIYRHAKDVRARLGVLLLSMILVFAFLLLFAPR